MFKQELLAEVVAGQIGMQHTCVCVLIACLEHTSAVLQ